MVNDIPVNENMPDDLKAALKFLNDRNVSLEDNPERVDDLVIEGDEDDNFDIEEDGETVVADDDEAEEIDFGDDVETDDLDNIF